MIDLLDVEARAKRRKAEARAAEAPSAQQRRADLIDALGRRSLDDAVNQEGLKWATNDPFAPHPPTTMSRHDVLAALQRVPDELLLRSIAADPAVLLASDVWPRVPTARNAGRDDELSALWRAERRFMPTLPRAQAEAAMARWEHAVRQATAG